MSGELERREALLAELLADPELEAALRRDPGAFARRREVAHDFVRALAALSADRIAAFRRSCGHKRAVRGGRRPTRIAGEDE